MSKLLKFYSKTCGPCKVLEKNLKQAEVEYKSIEVSTPDGEALSYKYGVMTVPTLILTDDNGDMLKKNVGILNVEQIKHFVNE